MFDFYSRLAGALLLLAGAASPAAAGEAPLPLHNQSALARGFALPAIGQDAVLGSGQSAAAARFDLTSEYHTQAEGAESVVLDGEADLLTLAWRRGLAAGWEWSAEPPLLHQGGGFMDGAIENWHDFWGLPQGGRPEAPQDRFLFQYVRNGQTLLDVRGGGSRLGDAKLGLGWQAAPWLAVRGEAKLPTGKQADLSGGVLGAALWLDAALPFDAGSIFSGFASAGVSINDDSEVLDDLREPFVVFGGGGLAARIGPQFAVLAQAYAHSALYRGPELDPFRAALQLSLGVRWHASERLSFDLAVQEDPIVSSSPDFSLHFGVSVR
jgi:hypothetical protein